MQLVVGFFKYIALVLLLCALAGCGGNATCIDADDFGFTTVTVSSRYPAKDLTGTQDNQIAPWVDKELMLSGKVVLIMVKNWRHGEDLNNKKVLSAWCPWWGTSKYTNILSPYCSRLQECRYNNQNIHNHNDPVNEGARCNAPLIQNAPCLMKRGVGLYVDLEKREAVSPNDSVVTMKKPNGVTMHLGAPLAGHSGYRLFDFSGKGIMRDAGGVLYDYDGIHSIRSNRLNYVNGKMYFKILDSYYEDNNGQYLVVIKSGLQEPGKDIFTIIEDLVQDRLFGNGNSNSAPLERNGIVRTIYQNIITAPGYSTSIRAALILYIAITGILFLIGSIQLTHTEVINRTIKVAIISALFNPVVSWDFFNEYLFVWFYQGSAYIIQVLKDSANIGPGDSNILTFLTTIQIMTKLISLLFATWQGWLYITIYFIMLVFLTMVLFEAAVLYMTAQVMMGLLICLAPIFISFYLFEVTKSFFENWLKQLIGYALQCILVSAGILFMTMIIRNQIYNTLGFRVCLKEFPDMSIGGGLMDLLSGSTAGDEPVISLFSWWFPEIAGWHDNPVKANIPIPKAHFMTTQDAALGFGFQQRQPAVGDFCEAYQCVGERYPDLPFLDPNNRYEARQMDILRSGDVVDFGGLFIVVVCIFLLNHFNGTLPSMAQFLSGTTSNYGNNEVAAGAASAGLSAPVRALGAAIDKKTGFAAFRERQSKAIHDFWDKKVAGRIGAAVSNWKAEKLENQALYTRGKIADNVEKKYGITQSKARAFGEDREFNTDLLKKTLSAQGLPDHSQELIKQLGKGKADNFDSILAKQLYNKDLKDLSASEKDAVNSLMKHDHVQRIVDAKKTEELFKQAYLESYTEMGKGPLSSREIRKQQQALKSDRNVAWLDDMKRNLSEGLLGGEADQMKYNDAARRTANEQKADRELALQTQINRKQLHALTVEAGRDIQRPDFLAKIRGMDNEALSKLSGREYTDMVRLRSKIDQYDAAIGRSINTDVKNSLNELKVDGSIMGDTYIRTKMNEEEFNNMISNVYAHGDALSQNDIYGRQSSQYKDNPAAMAEVEKRQEHISKAIEEEVERLHDVRNSEPEKANIYKSIGNAAKSEGERQAGHASNAANKVKQLVSGVEKAMSSKKPK